MTDLFSIPEPFITSELDFHRARITEDFASAELRRRSRLDRRRKRQQLQRSRSQRRNAPRTA